MAQPGVLSFSLRPNRQPCPQRLTPRSFRNLGSGEVYLSACIALRPAAAGLIELSSFQFDAEILDERPDEKSWWLNIEKHARVLLGLAVSNAGGVADLWEPLFVAADLYDGPRCWRSAVFRCQQVRAMENTMKNRRPPRTDFVIYSCLSGLSIVVGRMFSSFFSLPRQGANGETR